MHDLNKAPIYSLQCECVYVCVHEAALSLSYVI